VLVVEEACVEWSSSWPELASAVALALACGAIVSSKPHWDLAELPSWPDLLELQAQTTTIVALPEQA